MPASKRIVPLAIGAVALASLWSGGARAQSDDLARFLGEIDGFFKRIETVSGGAATWRGSDAYEMKRDGDKLIATVRNGKIVDSTGDELTFDSIELVKTAVAGKPVTMAVGLPHKMRLTTHDGVSELTIAGGRIAGAFDGAVGQGPLPELGNILELAVSFPEQFDLVGADGVKVGLTVAGGELHASFDPQTGRPSDGSLSIDNMRMTESATGSWVNLGRLAAESHLAIEPTGAWSGPGSFEMQNLAFSVPAGPAAGSIDRIAIGGRFAGPSIEQLRQVQARLSELTAKGGASDPDVQMAAFYDILPSLPNLVTTAQTELDVSGVEIRGPEGQPAFVLDAAKYAMAIDGLDKDFAAMRITYGHDGLRIAPELLNGVSPDEVPGRVVFDLGLENVSTAALRQMVGAAEKLKGGAQVSEADSQAASQGVMFAAAMLEPHLEAYEIAVETPKFGVSFKGEAKGSPISPQGYTAAGDVVIRGFDDMATTDDLAPIQPYLPALRKIALKEAAPDGTPRLRFHLSSNAAKPLIINDTDALPIFAAPSP